MTLPTTSMRAPLTQATMDDLIRRGLASPDARQGREAAFAAFAEAEMPRLERTDLSKVHLDDFHVVVEAGDIPADIREAMRGKDSEQRAGLFVQSNGEIVHAQLDPALASRGVILGSLSQATATTASKAAKRLGSVIRADENKLTALNSAFWTGGLFLYVPRNVTIETPVQVVFHADAPGGAVFPRVLVIAEESAAVTILEETISPSGDAPLLAASVTEVIVGANAQVKYIHLQNWGENTIAFITQRADVGRDAAINWTHGILGAQLMRSYTESRLGAEGATTEMLGVQFGGDHQHHDIFTLMNHVAPLTDGDLLFRGVLRDQARSVFEGLIKIHPGAQDANSYLHDNTLLLSKDARADSIPSPEIEANQVRASHGATVSEIDEDWIFYLQTRGLSRAQATRAIVDGFFEPIMQRITLESVQDRLRDAFDRKLDA